MHSSKGKFIYKVIDLIYFSWSFFARNFVH